MQSSETSERSAEHLRAAISYMAKHDAAFTPITYAVWYQYSTGQSPELNQELDGLTREGRKLDDASTQRVYDKFLADPGSQAAARMNDVFNQLLSRLSQSAVQAGKDATLFNSRLEQWSLELQGDLPASALEKSVATALEHVQQMQGSIASLNERLEQSQEEVNRLKQELARVGQEAQLDGLTGLLNRKAFDERLGALIAEASNGALPPSLIMIDIDHFKRINDQFGHVFGDRVLRTIADVLKASVKGKDTVARYGGEEFAVLLPETPLEGAEALAEQLRKAVEHSRIRKSDEIVGSISISAGVASYRNGEPLTRFVERADAALYFSKADGRNKVSLAGHE